MADCSYARCLQERRSIKRELQRWTKNMVYVVGLERVAEELMGRRKWKLYQDVLLARDLPLHQSSSEENDTTQEQSAVETQQEELNPPENNDSVREEQQQPMIATAEALQRNNSAADLTQDTTQKQEEKEVDRPSVDTSSPIPVDEDSKETKETQSIEEPVGQKEENNFIKESNQQTTLKIKTIEEINTVGNDNKKQNSNTNTTETILESLIKRSSTGPPRPKPLPTDWKPQDKCYFCVDGELVRPGAEQTSAPAPEPPPSPQIVGVESGSESGSSRSSPRVGQVRNALPNLVGVPSLQNQGQPSLTNVQANFLQAQAFAHLLQLQQARAQQQPTINQVQSMAASLATLGALPALNPALALCTPAFMPHWYLHQQRQQQERQNQEEQAASSPPRSPAPSAEQPLDLSAKPSSGPGTSNSCGPMICPPSPTSLEARLRGTPIDKQLFNRAKPRLAPTPGRRTYSEDDLQMALRDIQSGRLGTRRAAVIYNIPRSTLRNKVYKMEKERGARPPEQLSGAAHRVDDSNDNGEEIDDDKDSVNEEERDEEREQPQRPVLSMDDVLRYSQIENPSFGQSEHLRALLRKGQKFFDMSSPKQEPPPETWPLPEQSTMNSYIQQMLLANALGAAQHPKPEESTPAPLDIMRLFSQDNNILKETLLKTSHLNNGKQSELSEEELALNKILYSRQSSSASSVITKNDRATPRKTDSPEEIPMDVDHIADESRDSPSNVILKIPSFKPVGPGSNSGKNGGEGFPGSSTPPLSYFSHSPHPDIPGGRPSDRVSPTSVKGMFMLRDVIAKSISQKFQQSPVSNHNNDLRHLNVSSPGMDAMEGLNAFKRSNLTSPGSGQGISVIKNLTSHDLTRSFGSSNSGLQNQQNNATGGKGTRPKRGKYRNYDRDSLVEAVKAVQRGEMSVHRAGSYYGVPHSTLEYKVKERHLMRPRKREPKNPNPDDKMQTPSASKPSDIPGVGILRADKSKLIQKPPTKPNFPATSPNGLKMPPIFDGNLGLGYNPPPFPFWPHSSPFPGLPVDFQQRNPGGPGNFPPNSESFYASQMMQKLQEESARHPALARKDSVGESSSRDISDNTENASGANGSFVDSIIRSSLERQRPSGSEGENDTGESGRRRLRPDDLLLAEEMREAARRLRARESSGPLGVSPQSSQAHPS